MRAEDPAALIGEMKGATLAERASVTSPAGRTRIKICGMHDAARSGLAVAAGADAVGVIFAESPRRVAPDALRELALAIPPFVRDNRRGRKRNRGRDGRDSARSASCCSSAASEAPGVL